MACVYENEQLMVRGLENAGDPDLPEMLTPTNDIIGAGLHDKVPLLTNGQFSGGSNDFCFGTLLMKLALNSGKISPRRHQRLWPLQNWRPKFKISHLSLCWQNRK